MKKILVLCTGNSCRSQIAEGFLQHFTHTKAKIYSAGIEAHGVNPLAVETMVEEGIDISGQTSNLISEYSDIRFDFVITVCDNAKSNCPFLPGDHMLLHHDFPDPSKITGSPEQIRSEFRRTRLLIKEYIENFINDHLK